VYRALKSQGRSARTYIVTNRRKSVVGYYCISTGAVALAGAPPKLKRNMPDPILVIIIGRLGVDTRHQGGGIGRGLLKDAFGRIMTASDIVGVRAVLVHAIDQDAMPFYARFHTFPEGALTLFISMEDVIASL
jgi:hypothetical protein